MPIKEQSCSVGNVAENNATMGHSRSDSSKSTVLSKPMKLMDTNSGHNISSIECSDMHLINQEYALRSNVNRSGENLDIPKIHIDCESGSKISKTCDLGTNDESGLSQTSEISLANDKTVENVTQSFLNDQTIGCVQHITTKEISNKLVKSSSKTQKNIEKEVGVGMGDNHHFDEAFVGVQNGEHVKCDTSMVGVNVAEAVIYNHSEQTGVYSESESQLNYHLGNITIDIPEIEENGRQTRHMTSIVFVDVAEAVGSSPEIGVRNENGGYVNDESLNASNILTNKDRCFNQRSEEAGGAMQNKEKLNCQPSNLAIDMASKNNSYSFKISEEAGVDTQNGEQSYLSLSGGDGKHFHCISQITNVNRSDEGIVTHPLSNNPLIAPNLMNNAIFPGDNLLKDISLAQLQQYLEDESYEIGSTTKENLNSVKENQVQGMRLDDFEEISLEVYI